VGNGANLCFVRDRTAAKTAAIITTASSTTAPAFCVIHHALSTIRSLLHSSNYLPTLALLPPSLIQLPSRDQIQSQLTTCAPSPSSQSLVSASTARFWRILHVSSSCNCHADSWIAGAAAEDVQYGHYDEPAFVPAMVPRDDCPKLPKLCTDAVMLDSAGGLTTLTYLCPETAARSTVTVTTTSTTTVTADLPDITAPPPPSPSFPSSIFDIAPTSLNE
jgi:hypothetical protein